MVARITNCGLHLDSMHRPILLAGLAFAALSAPVSLSAQNLSRPTAAPLPPAIPDARDVDYPGTIRLTVDASDTVRNLMRVTEVIPVASGATELVLRLPEWHPGAHAPRGKPAQINSLFFTAGDQALVWRRDPVDVFAYRVTIPAGTAEVTAKFTYTTPFRTSEGRIVMTPAMLNLQWEKASLYPAGHYVRRITVQPTVKLPTGWQAATALDGQKVDGDTITWAATDYETLVDSPVLAGVNFKEVDLGHDTRLAIVADEPGNLAIAPAQIAQHRKLVDELMALYGSRHFDHYTMLLSLSDTLGGIGLEHHRSSENSGPPDLFTQWDKNQDRAGTMPHEMSHSWDGKFRRPEGLWTPDYHTPMINDLLWVYEGQDQFWGIVLSARSGIMSKDVVLGQIARYAGSFTLLPGRAWRPVSDTTYDPIFGARLPKPFASLSRGEDYYTEGMLVWLEADQVIRAGTGGKRGLDDFAKAFFGINDGDWGVVTYTFDDVVAGLNGIYPYDWATFLHDRLYRPGQPAPIAGIEKAGYRLVWKDTPNPYDASRWARDPGVDLGDSAGFAVDKDGKVLSVRYGSAAFDAGIVNDAKIVAVGGKAYSAEALKTAIRTAKGGTAPIALTVQRGDRVSSVALQWNEGLRYPWIEPVAKGEQPLDRLLAPRTGKP